jgi:porin
MARISSFCLLGIALPIAAPALAQDNGGSPTQPPAYSLPTPPAAPQPQRFRPAGPVYGDDNPNRRPFNAGSDTKGDTNQPSPGPLATIGKRLADEGIKFRALETNEYANVLRGGASQGDANVGQFYLGADLDFEKLFGWSGAKFHVTGYRDYGTSANKHISGTLFKQQDIYKNEFPQLHLGLFAFEQKLFNDKLDVIIGRLGTTAYYGHLQSNCFFQSGVTCGVPTVLNSESGFGLLPSATWGANVKYAFSKTVYAEAGAYEVNPTIADSNGFHHWSTKGATGFTVPFEVGYQNTNYRTTRYPTEVKGGFYASTATRADVFYNAKGQSAGLTGTALRNATSLRSGIYLMADRAIWRPHADTSQSITWFGGIVKPLERDEVVDREIYSGLILRQPFKSRPRDTVGLAVAWLHVSPGELAFLHDSRIHAGGPSASENPNEVNFEINYGIGIGRAIRLTPNFQYTVNPESSQLPKIKFVPKNMVTFGVKFTLDLASFLGFPGQEAGGD